LQNCISILRFDSNRFLQHSKIHLDFTAAVSIRMTLILSPLLYQNKFSLLDIHNFHNHLNQGSGTIFLRKIFHLDDYLDFELTHQHDYLTV